MPTRRKSGGKRKTSQARSLGWLGTRKSPEDINVQLCTRNVDANVFWVPQNALIQVFQFVQKEHVV